MGLFRNIVASLLLDMTTQLLFAAAVAALLATGPAGAQSRHAHALKSQHGGEVLEGRRHHFELVLLPAAGDSRAVELSLHVTDHHNRPVKVQSAAATAMVRAKGAVLHVPLALAGTSALKGEARFDADAALVVEVTVAIGKLPAETLAFRPLAPGR